MSTTKDMANITKSCSSSSLKARITKQAPKNACYACVTRLPQRISCYACVTRLPQRISCNVCSDPQTQSQNMVTVFLNLYLSKDISKYIDLRQVSYTCRKLLNLRKYAIYKLNKRNSLKYYSIKQFENRYIEDCCQDDDYNDDFDDLEFRKKVLNNIYNPHKQLQLNLSLCKNIFNVSDLRNVHTLDLSYCSQIRDVTALANIHTLYLKCCSNLVNVNVLKNVKILDVSMCYKIKNVSELGNVHTLILSLCFNIRDVSYLGKVNTLNLKGCFNITEFTALENVPHLVLP